MDINTKHTHHFILLFMQTSFQSLVHIVENDTVLAKLIDTPAKILILWTR